ncbi:hypothetical protein AVEN_211667-1, partial [Araneus ventricosus]
VPAVIAVFETGSEFLFSLKEKLGRFRILRCLYPNGLRNQRVKWDVSNHPAYSPDLATSDFHLFSEWKNWLGGQSFLKNEDIQINVNAHFTSLAATFREERIGNLVHRHEKCLNLYGDYVEK